MAIQIRQVTPYTGDVAVPGQAPAIFSQNAQNQLGFMNSLADELVNTISDMNNSANEMEDNAQKAEDAATASEAAASTAGYKGLWPDAGGSAEKGDTYQVQVGGTPTGEYYTALQNTSVDPVGDNVNWRVQVSEKSITESQNDIVVGLIFKGSNGETVENGDIVGSGITHLRASIGGNPFLLEMSPQASGVISEINDYTATIGGTTVNLLRMPTQKKDLFQYGFVPGLIADRAVNTEILQRALNDATSLRVPFVDQPLLVTSGVQLYNGQSIEFDSEYMGEALIADSDRGIIGDGSGPIFITDSYPKASNDHRQLRFDKVKLVNTNYPCVEVLSSDDFQFHQCNMSTTNAPTVKGRFSARVLIDGGRYRSAFDNLNFEDNWCIEFYDNCNGLEITPTTIISGGAFGGGVDVTQSQKVVIDGIYEVCGTYGQRVAGYNGPSTNVWAPSTYYSVGDEVKYTTNGWVCIEAHTSGASFDPSKFKVINGNCNAVSYGGYMEQVRRPISVGANNLVLGATPNNVVYSGNTALPENGIPQADFGIEIGAVVGMDTSGVSLHKQGAEPTFKFVQPFTGNIYTDYLVDSDLTGWHSQGGGPLYENNLTSSDLIGYIFGRNRIKKGIGIAPSGDVRTFTSDTITANAGTANNAYIASTEDGGVIDKVEIIEKNGDITSTVRVGSSVDSGENLIVDPETLTYTNGAADASLTIGLIRPSTQTILRVVAGSGSGTFRVRITYRV